MGKVTFHRSVSLDGFVAGSNDEVDQLFGWYFSGEKEIPVQLESTRVIQTPHVTHLQFQVVQQG